MILKCSNIYWQRPFQLLFGWRLLSLSLSLSFLDSTPIYIYGDRRAFQKINRKIERRVKKQMNCEQLEQKRKERNKQRKEWNIEMKKKRDRNLNRRKGWGGGGASFILQPLKRWVPKSIPTSWHLFHFEKVK